MKTYLDIETIPSQKPGMLEEIRATIEPPGSMSKPETIAKWLAENADAAAEDKWRKTALDGTRGELVVIGFATNDGQPLSHYRSLGQSEGDMLQNAFDDMALSLAGTLSNPLFVGHNVLGFDIRFLFQRAVVLGIKPPFQLPTDQRYNGERVFDTMLAWAGWGNRISLAKLCAALGIAVKTGGIDGSMVWDYVQAGRVQEVASYCEEDVAAVREVYRRMTFQEVAG